jgi:hypothetical protein
VNALKALIAMGNILVAGREVPEENNTPKNEYHSQLLESHVLDSMVIDAMKHVVGLSSTGDIEGCQKIEIDIRLLQKPSESLMRCES